MGTGNTATVNDHVHDNISSTVPNETTDRISTTTTLEDTILHSVNNNNNNNSTENNTSSLQNSSVNTIENKKTSSVYENVPKSLVTRIKKTLRDNLSLCNHNDPLIGGWSMLFQRDGISVYQKPLEKKYNSNKPSNAETATTTNSSANTNATNNNNNNSSTTSIIKSVSVIDNHPKQVFNLLIDNQRRKEYEANVDCHDRMLMFNKHTFLDYYSYRKVWP